jgi:protein TonB
MELSVRRTSIVALAIAGGGLSASASAQQACGERLTKAALTLARPNLASVRITSQTSLVHVRAHPGCGGELETRAQLYLESSFSGCEAWGSGQIATASNANHRVTAQRDCAVYLCSTAWHTRGRSYFNDAELATVRGNAVRAGELCQLGSPPPPPPPPPPAPKSAVQPKVIPKPVVQDPSRFVAPVEVPEQIKPEEGLDLGVEGGVPGGVEGGVPGGVVGGVVGGLPDAPPPMQAVRVGGQIKEPKKLKNITPVYPDIAKQARVQGVVILECTISPQGKVTDVKVLRGIPLLDAAAIEAVKQWVYTPTLLNGVPVPVIMTVTVNFRLS